MSLERSADPADPTPTARAAGVRVLGVEARALDRLAAGLDESFDRAVDALFAAAGRIIVTGIGKSGHVGRKIAATFASTGTPAFFVHPSEASHGDLGMIAPDDAVLALSNSGGTAELADIIAYTRRFAIGLIGVTGRARSALAEQADVVLLLPDAPEACPMGLSPTTSTTMMMALGDALAIALLERRGFSPDAYHVLHPGGALGRRLVKVSDVMHEGEAMPLAGPDTAMADAVVLISARSLGCVGIVDAGGNLAGIITDGDLRRHMGPDLLARRAGEIMTPRPRTIRPGALAAEAAAVMSAHAITSLFVTVDAGGGHERPVGIVHIHDCLRAGVDCAP